MARWIRLVKAHPTMASTWSTSIVLKYRTGEFGFPGDLRYYQGDLRGWKPGGYTGVRGILFCNTLLSKPRTLILYGIALT